MNSAIKVLAEFQRIWGFCPCCAEPFRLSEARTYLKKKPPGTEFDALREDQERLQRGMERFDEQLDRIKKKETELGQREAKRALRRIDPVFSARGINPQEVRVLFDPVIYVAFVGLKGNGLKRIELVDAPATSKEGEAVQESLAGAIQKGNLEWKEYRVGDDGKITAK